MRFGRKKIILVIIGVIILVAGRGFFRFYRSNINLKPVFLLPPVDITKVINTTGMPLHIPEGFAISIFAKGFNTPRVLVRDPAGRIVVSDMNDGSVVVMPDKNNDGIADEKITLIAGLNKPHGLAFNCPMPANAGSCKLYVAETNEIAVYDYDTAALQAAHKKKLVDLPAGGNHITRTLVFDPRPDGGRLLVSVGSTCNVCHEKDERRAKILSVRVDGSDTKEFARGLRNAVFMAMHPVTGKLWVTEMARDLLGDDIPPDEINVVEEGKNYGWPICYGKNIHDDEFDKNTYIRNPCEEPFETGSFIDVPAHSAPLGLAFIPKEGWPRIYAHDLLVAYHGSWNRSVPTGYKIVRYRFDAEGNYKGVEDFVTGWLTPQNEAIGRPVDLLATPEGTLYISDDKAGVIYFMRRTSPPSPQ